MRKLISLLLLVFLLNAGCNINQTSTPKTDKLANMDFREVVARAKSQVFPMVVYIKCLRQDHAGGKKITQEVSGSGVIVSADGEVVTNWHVVDKAVEVGAKIIGASAMMYITALNIKGIREKLDRRGLSGKILLAVGGAVFRLRKGLIDEVGADGGCQTALQVPALFENLLKQLETEEL